MEKIVGSVGRWSDFDPSFLPARASVGERWKHIDRAYHRGEDLPPVELYKIGDAYFVVDGSHRVSVARYHGAQWIDARAIEVGGPVSEKTRLRLESREHRVLLDQLAKELTEFETVDANRLMRLIEEYAVEEYLSHEQPVFSLNGHGG